VRGHSWRVFDIFVGINGRTRITEPTHTTRRRSEEQAGSGREEWGRGASGRVRGEGWVRAGQVVGLEERDGLVCTCACGPGELLSDCLSIICVSIVSHRGSNVRCVGCIRKHPGGCVSVLCDSALISSIPNILPIVPIIYTSPYLAKSHARLSRRALQPAPYTPRTVNGQQRRTHARALTCALLLPRAALKGKSATQACARAQESLHARVSW
jgi:hypothetical protein